MLQTAADNNILLKQIDHSQPLGPQGPFNVIIHKLRPNPGAGQHRLGPVLDPACTFLCHDIEFVVNGTDTLLQCILASIWPGFLFLTVPNSGTPWLAPCAVLLVAVVHLAPLGARNTQPPSHPCTVGSVACLDSPALPALPVFRP